MMKPVELLRLLTGLVAWVKFNMKMYEAVKTHENPPPNLSQEEKSQNFGNLARVVCLLRALSFIAATCFWFVWTPSLCFKKCCIAWKGFAPHWKTSH